METFIGRKDEIRQLTDYYNSGRAEFIAIYGRRRIGKTYLVRNVFRDKFCFEMSGSIGAGSEAQMSNFVHALHDYGYNTYDSPMTWTDAFFALRFMGGIPYYLVLLEKDKNMEANIDRLFFAERGELKREYNRLYASLFKNSEIYMKVIEALASCKQGLTRKQISEKIKATSGGTLTKVIRELVNCDFVRGYNTREKKIKQKDQIYQLTDLYTLFYMQFCHKATTDEHYWTNMMENHCRIHGTVCRLSASACCISRR